MNAPSGRSQATIMNRSDLTRRLVARLGDGEAVVGGIGYTNFDLWASGQRPENFYMLGSMGLASSIALGVSLAQPERFVFALDGDGSILMQLGALGTVASVAPRRFCIIIWDNGLYHITGGQETMTASVVDLVAVARGMGIARADWALDEAHFDDLVGAALEGQGPSLIAARIDDTKPAGTTEREPVKLKLGFMRGIGG